MIPTLRQLSFLRAIADTGSFTAAAVQAAVAQPSLSAGIKELEAILGARLVERSRSGARLTHAGAEAARRARAILAAAEEMGEAVRGAAEPLSGVFRLGVIPTIAPFLLPRALPGVKSQHPRLKLHLREDLTARLIDGLRAHTLDAALIALPYDAPGIETLALFDDEFLFIAPQGHPLLERQGLSPADLGSEPVLLLEDGHCLRDHTLGVCGTGRPGNEDVRATSLFTLVEMAAGGLGVSLLPRLAASLGTHTDALVARPFDPPVIGRQIGMAWRRGSVREAEARALGKLFVPSAQTVLAQP
jgi:LysR family transcriptional regulator, hydrogen peroxide-inducible genes activator